MDLNQEKYILKNPNKIERKNIMSKFYDIVKDETLTFQQQIVAMARLAESQDDTLKFNPLLLKAKQEGIICDLNEGNTPYRPRYIIVNFEKFMQQGSKFLELEKPNDLMEALNNLQILYRHIPSITTYPVYLGDLDTILEEYVVKEDYEFAKKLLRLFLLNIDRTLTDSFVHANIGPKETVTGNILVELTSEMQLAIPNITLKYDENITNDKFANKCIQCMLKTAKPSFANDKLFISEWGNDYAIASCYNGLTKGGGGFTLPRLRLYEMSLEAEDINDFKDNVLVKYTNLMLEFMDQRIEFIVEKSSFFKSNFLVTEGLLELDKFTGMVGVVGLAECVNKLLNIIDPKQGFGNNEKADDLGEEIVKEIEMIVNNHKAKYAKAFDHKYRLHAQVGIDTDNRSDSPGARIPIGCEPELLQQVLHSTRYHKYFPTGIGDIFKFENTWYNTPNAILDIIKGAFNKDMRYFTGYLDDCDVVRVTGYLVKKSEIAKLEAHKQSLNNVTLFGKGARDTADALDRKIN